MQTTTENKTTPSPLKKWISGEAAAALGTMINPAVSKRPRSAAKRQPIEAATLPDALLKMSTVIAVTGISSATIYRKVAAGEFPTPIRLGARCTRWHAGSVRAWLAAQTTSAVAVAVAVAAAE